MTTCLRPLLMLVLGLALLAPLAAQTGVPFNQRDDEYRLLGLKRARSAYEAARADWERNRQLFDKELIAREALETSRRVFADAEVNYQQSLLAVLFEMQYVTVAGAVKYQGEDNRKHVRLTLANASGGSAEYRQIVDMDDELFRSLQPDVVHNVYVSLLNDGSAIIGQPYEVKIDRLRYGEPVTIEFALLQDLDAVTVNLVYGNGTTRSPKIYLQKDASVDRVIVQSQQFSQEVELGGSADFDLTLELFSGLGDTYKLEVVNLPDGINRYFTDASGQARLSQFKFTETANTRAAALRVFLPDRDTDTVRAGTAIPFYVLVIPRSRLADLGEIGARTWTREEIEALQVGYVRLELVPRGVGRLLVKAPQLYQAIPGDGRAEAVLTVRNDGTRPLDNIEIAVDPPLGWEYEVDPPLLERLAVAGEARFALNFVPPAEVTPGKYEFRVRTTSFSEKQPITGEDKTFTVEVLPETNWLGTALVTLLILGLVAGIVVFGVRLSRR